jgi:predicted AAA+ superfamily ATPase
MIKRDCKPSKTNSFFLFGARGTGKTTLILDQFESRDTLFLDLLDNDLFDQLMLDSSRFEAIINSSENKFKRVVVDEIQKLPKLLDVIHQQIQKYKRQFILTGSSARKLKQKSTNLLAGRAWVYNLYPLSAKEISKNFQENINLAEILMWGGLPEVVTSKDNLSKKEFLSAYIVTYLQKEIQQERWVKNLEPFRKFLAIAAQMNGKIINKSKIAKEIGVNDVTVQNYFEILEETLLGFMLPAYHRSVRKAQRQMPKFYFIDTGIKRAIDRTLTVELLPQTSQFGDAFEHWVILEIIKNASYHRFDWEFSYIRTKEDVEIDLIINRPGQPHLFIEIKSKKKVSIDDAKSLLTLGQDLDQAAHKWILSNDPLAQDFGNNTRALHWIQAIVELFPQVPADFALN